METLDKKIKALIKAHRKTGSITLAQLNAALPDGDSTPERIEAAMQMIEEAGLDIVEEDQKGKDKKGGARKEDDDGGGDEVDLPELDLQEPSEAELAAPIVDITEKIDDRDPRGRAEGRTRVRPHAEGQPAGS